MELSDAIRHLEEILSDVGHKWDCEECKKEHEQLLNWLKELEFRRKIEHKSCKNCCYLDPYENYCCAAYQLFPYRADFHFTKCERWKLNFGC